MPESRAHVLVGGSGRTGSALASRLASAGADVTIVDRNRPPATLVDRVRWQPTDLLTDCVALPPGRVVILTGTGEKRPAWSWTLPLDIAVSSARLAPALAGRDVTLISSAEVYGWAEGPLSEETVPKLPWTASELWLWCGKVMALGGAGPAPPWRSAPVCRQLTEADPDGRWIYGLSKLAQEIIVASAQPHSLTIWRVGELFGDRHDGIVAEMIRRALANRPIRVTKSATRSLLSLDDALSAFCTRPPAGVYNLGGTPVALSDVVSVVKRLTRSFAPVETVAGSSPESCGIVDSGAYEAMGGTFTPLPGAVKSFVTLLEQDQSRLFEPPIPVIIPARPVRPDEVAERQAAALWSGRLKSGQPWSSELAERLSVALGVDRDPTRRVVLTTSGTAALRLAILSLAGRARAGAVAVLPSYTFAATAEVLVQLGYTLRFADVDSRTWTIDVSSVEAALARGAVGVVVAVDTFGNPADYPRLQSACAAYGVPLVADSAASLGSRTGGVPVATQAGAHAYSMSFAKAIQSGGMGGCAVLPADARFESAEGWDRSEYMSELHAIAGLDQLVALEVLVARRQAIAEVYNEGLAGLGGLVSQAVTEGATSAWAHYVVRVRHRARSDFASALAADGIVTRPYFPALHLERFSSADEEPLPVTEALDQEALAIPMSSEMTIGQAQRVIVGMKRAERAASDRTKQLARA